MIVGFHQRMLGVYVEIGRKAMVSGNVGVHQFVRIGELAMIGGLTMVTQDFPPYFMLDNRGLCVGINRITHEAVKRRRLCRFLKRVERPLRLGRFSSFNKLRYQKIPVREAILQGTETLVRPITMTALAAILGLLPAAFSTQIGSQSQRPLAIVVVGGMLSTLVFFNLVPLLYSYYGHREPLVGVGHGHD